MKNLFALLVFTLALTACQKELNFDTPPQSNAACKACTYIPFCNGSVYTYIDTTLGGITTSTDTIKIIKDTTIDSKVFQKSIIFGADGYHNCSGGVTTAISLGVPVMGVTIGRLEQILLKANDPVGATWNNVAMIGGQNVTFKYSIVAKGITKTLLGVTYNDVIRVHLSLLVTVPIVGQVVIGESDYYYANNIGLIENITYSNGLSGTPTLVSHRVLKTYSIP